MTFWTILTITALSGILSGTVIQIPYPSHQSCEAATAIVSDTLGFDHSMTCDETATASRSIRPVRNVRYDHD